MEIWNEGFSLMEAWCGGGEEDPQVLGDRQSFNCFNDEPCGLLLCVCFNVVSHPKPHKRGDN